jgi:hypothetical protein
MWVLPMHIAAVASEIRYGYLPPQIQALERYFKTNASTVTRAYDAVTRHMSWQEAQDSPPNMPQHTLRHANTPGYVT